ncbi:MAG: HipA family kinase [Candidatus Acidiferrales bacterium]
MGYPSQTEIPVSANRLRAVEEIRRMRGGSQSHLMRCSDGQYYVVKFQNNPQHRRVLVNELLATRLAARLGLPTTPTAIVEVSEELIRRTDDLVMEMPRNRVPCMPGLQFGSRLFGSTRIANTLGSFPQGQLFPREQLVYFAGMLAFDKWTCNTDGRQTLFLWEGEGQSHSMVMIDQGFCFNCGEWNFPDSALRGLYARRSVYAEIRSLDDFEPWLGRLETEFTLDVLFDAANGIPPEWYEFDTESLHKLLERLNRRRSIVRELLSVACKRLPYDFPKWVDRQQQGGDFRSAGAGD